MIARADCRKAFDVEQFVDSSFRHSIVNVYEHKELNSSKWVCYV